jgi:hypothetical protein
LLRNEVGLGIWVNDALTWGSDVVGGVPHVCSFDAPMAGSEMTLLCAAQHFSGSVTSPMARAEGHRTEAADGIASAFAPCLDRSVSEGERECATVKATRALDPRQIFLRS